MNNYLMLSALSSQRSDVLNAVARTIQECKCSISDSRLTALGQGYGLIALVHGNWNSLAKLELQLERLAQANDFVLNTRRTQIPEARADALPYAVEVIALEQPGIVFRLADFFASRTIPIEDLASRSYRAVHTGAAMCAVNVVVGVPSSVHIALLREEFMDFCDQFNWDAVLEPVKV